MAIVLLTSDLMVTSRVEGAAALARVPFQSAVSEDDALSRCEAIDATLLLIDLSRALTDVKLIVAGARSLTRTPLIVAFGPHVHKERLAAAREADCDMVLSRGQFFSDLETVVRRASRAEADQGTAGGG